MNQLKIKIRQNLAVCEDSYVVMRPGPVVPSGPVMYGQEDYAFTVYPTEERAEEVCEEVNASDGRADWRVGRIFFGWPLPEEGDEDGSTDPLAEAGARVAQAEATVAEARVQLADAERELQAALEERQARYEQGWATTAPATDELVQAWVAGHPEGPDLDHQVIPQAVLKRALVDWMAGRALADVPLASGTGEADGACCDGDRHDGGV